MALVFTAFQNRPLSKKRQLHLSAGSSLYSFVTAGMPHLIVRWDFLIVRMPHLDCYGRYHPNVKSMNLRPVAMVSLCLEKDMSEKTSFHMGLLIG